VKFVFEKKKVEKKKNMFFLRIKYVSGQACEDGAGANLQGISTS
jgi:hypothetical protein